MRPQLLLIDDSLPMEMLVKALLSEIACELCYAPDGASGIDLAVKLRPDLILLDIDMPAPNGYEVCRRLKSMADIRDIPIIFLTGASTTAEKVRGLNLGATDYITKPFDPAELLARVRAHLRTKQLIDLLAERALTDGLTGLRNRLYLNQRLAAERAASSRKGHPLGCIMFDIDNFKRLNDTFGHPFGDSTLCHVARIAQSVCRGEDVLCRYGGEEFAVLTPGIGSSGAAVLAERVREGIASHPFTAGRQRVTVTASFGVAESTAAETSPLLGADVALYQAKRAGKNCVCVAETSELTPA